MTYFATRGRRASIRSAAIMLVGGVVGIVGVTGLAVPSASAAPPRNATGVSAFYTPPSPLPKGAPGDIVRSQPLHLPLSLPGNKGTLPAVATRIMYRSNNTHGAPTVMTGAFLRSTLPWRGPGKRPIVALAVGTQGQGDHCGPSQLLDKLISYKPPLDIMVEYELAVIYPLLARGMSVVATDYYGIGTPWPGDYENRLSQGHAVLDSVRAAQRLTGSGVTAQSPAIVYGYSQGGSAAASAAELQGTYAPELPIRGTYAGAVGADLRSVMQHAPAFLNGPTGDGALGGIGVAVTGYVLNGLYADYPDTRTEIDKALSPLGHRMLREVSNDCLVDTGLRGFFQPARWFTTGGLSVEQILDRSPALAKRIDDQRIGTLRPVAPVLVVPGSSDDALPIGQQLQLARDWCAKGAALQYKPTTWIPPVLPSTAIGHVLPFIPATIEAMRWVDDRLAGKPVTTNCAALPQNGDIYRDPSQGHAMN